MIEDEIQKDGKQQHDVLKKNRKPSYRQILFYDKGKKANFRNSLRTLKSSLTGMQHIKGKEGQYLKIIENF